MTRLLIVALIAAAALAGAGLLAPARPALAQAVTEGGPVSSIVIATFPAAFWSPPPESVPADRRTVGVPAARDVFPSPVPVGEILLTTLPPAFRTAR
jgi:hypothetical protein